MRLSHLSLVLLASLAVAGSALGYTMPGTFPYDALVTYDRDGMPITAGTFHVAAAPGYWMASKAYDVDGNAQDLLGSYSIIAVPIDLGYAINERIMADVTVQFLMPKFKPDTGDETSSSGLGDIWVKGRYVAPVGNMYLGGRLGVKAPVGKWKDLDPDEIALGDGQMDVDVALVAGMNPEAAGFAGMGQLGFRYRMKKTYDIANPLDPSGVISVEYTPGMLIYTQLEPGYKINEAFAIYVPILYETSMKTKSSIDGTSTTNEDSDTSGLAVGLAPKYALDANNNIGLKFLYPVMGKNVYQAMDIAVTYEGNIKF